MNKDTLILKDGTVIELEPGASLSEMGVIFPAMEDMETMFKQLTKENLSEVQVKNGDGEVIANYTNLILVNETSTEQTDGTILTYFNFRRLSDVEIRIARAEERAEQNTADIDYLAMETGVEL